MIRVARDEPGIVVVTFDRPQARNAFTFAMWDELAALATELSHDARVRAVVFTGAGEKAFVSGTDIGEFAAFRSGADGVAYEARVERAIAALERIPVPAVAAIRGACTGGGVSIAAACDVRIGGPSTRVGIPIARTLGNIVSLRNIARLAAIVGADAARALLLTATLLDAREAQRRGFLSEVTDDDDRIIARALEAARAMAALAPRTLAAAKALTLRLLAALPLAGDTAILEEVYGSADFREGVAAFTGRRPPHWTGT